MCSPVRSGSREEVVGAAIPGALGGKTVAAESWTNLGTEDRRDSGHQAMDRGELVAPDPAVDVGDDRTGNGEDTVPDIP